MTAILCAGRRILQYNSRISAQAWRVPISSARSTSRKSFQSQRSLGQRDRPEVLHGKEVSTELEGIYNAVNPDPQNSAEASLDSRRVECENPKDFLQEFKKVYDLPPTSFSLADQVPIDLLDQRVATTGFLNNVKKLSEHLVFGVISRENGAVQIMSKDPQISKKLLSIKTNSAISVTGQVKQKYAPKKKGKNTSVETAEPGKVFSKTLELDLEDITCLNSFDSHSNPDHNYQLQDRHLQLRFDATLQRAIKFRSDIAACVREELKDFTEIETPILFKSTPEGAKEFLVPTRKPGFAYALPQSPQQYKQVLMAGGITKYMQLARCFRDEDLRADRQPEFTQIDLEMAWTDGEGVMMRVERLIKALYARFAISLSPAPFHRLTYDEAMSKHGSDKPDLRIPGLIQRIDHIVTDDLRRMLTDIEDPIIEACKIPLGDSAQQFLRDFFSTSDGKEFQSNPDGAPGIAIYDTRRPLEGLQIFGFEGAEKLKELYSNLSQEPFQTVDQNLAERTFEEGDVMIVQARENKPHSGGSTALGRLRLAIYKAAIEADLLPRVDAHHYLWVTDFPMFTPDNGVDPGQGGSAGFSATHHPFTAPKTAADADLLLTDPLSAKADHYDLVVNGVELGGGSRRIHSAKLQRYIMEHVLQMEQARIDDFAHLLRALAAGCPPHAGLAIGFDRLVAVMSGTTSVRDVIAFPKSSKGSDLLVGSPRRVGGEELGRYSLRVMEGVREQEDVVEEGPLEERPPSEA